MTPFVRLAAALLLLAPLHAGAQLSEAQVEDLAAQAKGWLRLSAERVERARAAHVPLMTERTAPYAYREPLPGYLPSAVSFSTRERPQKWTREVLEARLYPAVLARLRGDSAEIDRRLVAWRSNRGADYERSAVLAARFAFELGITWVWQIHLDDAALQIGMLRFEFVNFNDAAQRDIEAKFKEIAQRHGKDFEKIGAESWKAVAARDLAWKSELRRVVAEYRSIFDRLAVVRRDLAVDVGRWDSYMRGIGLSPISLRDPEEDFIPEGAGSRRQRALDRFYRPHGGSDSLSNLELPNVTLIELVDPVVQNPAHWYILNMTALFGGKLLDPATGRVQESPIPFAAPPMPPVAAKPPATPAATRAPELVSPAPGAVLPEGAITFEWRDNGTALDAWSIIVPAGHTHRKILTPDPEQVASRWITLERLPPGAGDIAVQLWYRTAGEWRHVEARYLENRAAPPELRGPEEPALHLAVSTDDWLQPALPGEDEVLVFVHRDKALLLPARFNVLRLPEGRRMVEALSTEPAIGKAGLRLANAGLGNGGYAVAFDAGGSRLNFPHALEEAKRALNVSSVRDVIQMHIDKDHVESLRRLLASEKIRSIIVPEEFLANPEAPRSDLARFIAGMNLGNRLRRLRAPAGEGFFHGMEYFGDLTVEWYGNNAVFRKLAEQRARGGRNQSARDAASLLLVVTHNPSQTRVAYVGDLRGQDIAGLFDVMGRERFQEAFNGVTVVSGWSHHMGRLDPADKRGWLELYEATFLRSGRLDVIVQAGSEYNRALVDALLISGVNVHVAKSPPSPERSASISVGTDGLIHHRGRHATDEFISPSRIMERLGARTAALATAIEALRDYPHELPASLRQQANELRTEYANLRRAALRVPSTGMDGVPLKAEEYQRHGLTNMTEVLAALRNAGSMRLGDPQDTAWRLKEWTQFRPFYGQFLREVARARTTGRLSRAGIGALAGLNYFYVMEVLQREGFSEAERQRILRAYPKIGTTVPFRQRTGAAAVLLMTLAADVAVHWPEVRTWFFNMDVAPSLSDFQWWESKGVFVEVDGVDDNLSPFWDNERKQKRERIVELLRQGELSHMAMTGVPKYPPGAEALEEEAFRLTSWDLFTGWASVSLLNLRDWHHHIAESKSIRPASGAAGCEREGPRPGLENWAWCYRTHRIADFPGVFLVRESWRRDEDLTRILRAAAASMIDRTEAEIARLAHADGPPRQPGPEGNLAGYFHREIFEGKPRALRKVRFVNGVDTVVYSTELEGSRPARSHGGFTADSVFYQFDPAKVPGFESIPDGYVLLGGANYDAYNRIYSIRMYEAMRQPDGTPRVITGPNTTELVLGWAAHLTEVK